MLRGCVKHIIKMLRKQLFIILLLIFSNNICIAKNLKINEINFKGLKRIHYESALRSVPFYPGSYVSYNDISRMIHSLYDTGYFENIKVLLNDVNDLVIKVSERPTISNISISGNKSLKKDTIDKLLQENNLCKDDFFNRSTLFYVEKIIKDFYYNIGKYNINCNVTIKNLPNNQVDIKLNIIEGISAKIQQINILGNSIYSKKYLLSILNLRDNKNWWDLLKSRQYKKQQLLQDLESLRDLYLNNGYARFNIDSTQIHLTPDKTRAFITINIFEGKQYKIFNTFLKGSMINKNHLNNIKNIIKIHSGTIYNNQKIQNIEHNIKKYLNRFGYYYSKINTQIEINDKNNYVKIYFFVNPNNVYFVRHIMFIGNNKSKDLVLRREMTQIESDVLNYDKLEQGKHRLNRTGFFENVSFDVKPILKFHDQVDVIYTVKERNTGSLNLGLGYGNENGINFQIGVNQDNWLGSGNFLGINATKTISKTHAEFSFNNPYLTANGLSLGSNIFYNNFKSNSASISDYNNQSYGLELTLGLPFNEYNKFRIGINYVHNELSNIKPHIAIKRYLDSIKQYSILNHNTKFSVDDLNLNYGWKYNNLDRSIFPRLGNEINLNGKITIPKLDNNFYKININMKNYFSLNTKRNFILLSHINLGYGNGMFGKYLPFYENFYGGGSNTVRGFRLNTIGPKAVYYNKNLLICSNDKILCKSNDAIGGNVLTMMSLELIIPNPLLQEQYSNFFRTSVFIDTGTIYDTKWKNNLNNYLNKIPDYSYPRNFRISSGISLQWMSPMGPLSISYSYPIKKFQGDQIEPFQLSINNNW